MEDKRIIAEEILAEIDIDVNQMAQKVAGGRQPIRIGSVYPFTSHVPNIVYLPHRILKRVVYRIDDRARIDDLPLKAIIRRPFRFGV